MKREIKRLEEIAKNVIEKKIKQEDGANEVLDIIYRNKGLFGLSKMDMDNLHDYMLFFRKKIIHLFEAFNVEYGYSFIAFLNSSVQRSLIAWKRHKANVFIKQESCESFGILTYEEQLYNYQQNESCNSYETNKTFSYKNTIKSLLESFSKETKKRRAKPLSRSERNNSLRKAACLVLALKLSYYIDNDTIKKVCCITGIQEKELVEVVHKINDSMQSKIERHEKHVKSRNSAFFFHRKFMLEYEKLDKESLFAIDIEKKFKKQTEFWKSRNDILNKHRFMAIPSNTTISKIIDVDERKICYIIYRATLCIDTISQKQYHDQHENILSNRELK